MTDRRAFIAGCQRSGTTLVRLILESHSMITCLDEEEAYRALCGSGESSSAVPFASLKMYKIPRFTEQLLAPEYSDAVYGRFPPFYRGEPVLFVVRRPDDVVASMLALSNQPGNPEWIEHHALPILQHRSQDDCFLQRYARELDLIESNPEAKHVVGAVYWKYKVDSLFDYLDAGLPIFPLQYERLVAEPRPVLKAIISWLGLSWEEVLLHHHELEHTQLSSKGIAIGGTDPRRPIDVQSVGRSQESITSVQRRDIASITHEVWMRVEALVRDFEPMAPYPWRKFHPACR